MVSIQHATIDDLPLLSQLYEELIGEKIKEAFIRQDKGKAEKIFKLLNGLTGATSSLATIATFFGLSF